MEGIDLYAPAYFVGAYPVYEVISKMSYFITDIKKLYKSKLVRWMLLAMLLVMILDPISVRLQGWRWLDAVGRNAYLYWLLMDMNWGNRVYQALFCVFPVLSTGLIYYNEKHSSVYDMLISRGHAGMYYLAKMCSTFLTTFFNFTTLFLINVFVTYSIFPINAPQTEQYGYHIPKTEMFSYMFYEKNPLDMVLLYVFLNAFTIALNSLLVLAVHEIIPLKNRYLALLVPVILLQLLRYLMGMAQAGCPNMNLNVILQPNAASALVNTIYMEDVRLVFGILIIVVIFLQGIGFLRNRESL